MQDQCKNIFRQLHGWLESLKNSPIEGQRRLDDNSRKAWKMDQDREEFIKELETIRKRDEKNPKR
jgi:hypothetical protein